MSEKDYIETVTPGSSRPRRDSSRTRRAILAAAMDEFAEHGFSGARVERIVARAATNMRLVYHHFGSKDGLYAAVIEHVYEQIRLQERQLDLNPEQPLLAMRRLVDFTIEHFRDNPAFLKLTTYENTRKGTVVTNSSRIRSLSSPLIATIRGILEAGYAKGSIRRRVDPLQIYITIVALACHHLNNVYTLSATFGTDLADEAWLMRRHDHVVDVVLSYLTNNEGQP